MGGCNFLVSVIDIRNVEVAREICASIVDGSRVVYWGYCWCNNWVGISDILLRISNLDRDNYGSDGGGVLKAETWRDSVGGGGRDGVGIFSDSEGTSRRRVCEGII